MARIDYSLLQLAQATPRPSSGGQNIPMTSIDTAQSALQSICSVFAWAFYFLLALTVVFIVLAAFKYLTSSGNPEKVQSATSMIIYAAIAVGVALLARAIPLIVANLLGAQGSFGAC